MTMFPLIFGLQTAGGSFAAHFYGDLQALGLESNLLLCLDAGSSLSITSSTAQLWMDISAGARDFSFGATTSTGGDDPAFNGTPGALSSAEFLSFDGGDILRLNSTNDTSIDDIHRDQSEFTLFLAHYPAVSIGTQGLMGTIRDGSNAPGFRFQYSNTEKLRINVKNGSGDALLVTADSTSAESVWHFSAVSVKENGGSTGGFFWEDSSYMAVSSTSWFNPTFSSPTTAAATDTMEIGANGNSSLPLVNGYRVALVAVWSQALTKEQLDSIWSRTATRFGLS